MNGFGVWGDAEGVGSGSGLGVGLGLVDLLRFVGLEIVESGSSVIIAINE